MGALCTKVDFVYQKHPGECESDNGLVSIQGLVNSLGSYKLYLLALRHKVDVSMPRI